MAWSHKHVRFQPTISANRKRYRTTLHTNGPTIGANSPQTTVRPHTPCKRTTPERGGHRSDCPISNSFRDSRRRHFLVSQGPPASPSGETTHPFWDRCLERTTRSGGLRLGSVAIHTVAHQIERTEPNCSKTTGTPTRAGESAVTQALPLRAAPCATPEAPRLENHGVERHTRRRSGARGATRLRRAHPGRWAATRAP